jgi:BNR repeat protein
MSVRASVALGSVLLASVLAPAVAGARPYAVTNLRAISGPSPFAAGCPGAGLDETRIAGAEIEPAITVNPAHSRNIVATWQQDLGRGAARTDLIGTSRDGGRTWKRVKIPGLSRCTGGSADVATDPWLSAGADGTVYFSGAVVFTSSDPPPAALFASHSRNQGRSWSRAVRFAGPSTRLEREVITADPKRPRHAYAVWWERDPKHEFVGGIHRFARTTDGGATWSTPKTLDTAPAGELDQSAEILVLPNGKLLALFARFQLGGGGAFQKLFAARSRDQGRTWSRPLQVVSQPVQPILDPETGDQLSNQDMTFHSAAIAPDGTVYVAWDRNRSATSGTIDIAKSRDGGLSWSGPAPLRGATAFTFEPAIAVDSRGTVGLMWYDTRNDRRGDAALTTDVWFARSADRGHSWKQIHVAGPFDFRTAPRPSGNLRLGEYQGLTGLRTRGFAAVFTQAAPRAEHGPTDIFFARIEPRPCVRSRFARLQSAAADLVRETASRDRSGSGRAYRAFGDRYCALRGLVRANDPRDASRIAEAYKQAGASIRAGKLKRANAAAGRLLMAVNSAASKVRGVRLRRA